MFEYKEYEKVVGSRIKSSCIEVYILYIIYYILYIIYYILYIIYYILHITYYIVTYYILYYILYILQMKTFFIDAPKAERAVPPSSYRVRS